MFSLFDQGPPAPCPDPFNMAAYVLGSAATLPEKPALEILFPDRSEVWTYSELEKVVRATATGLQELGLKPGDRVLMRLGNTVEFPIAFLACIAVDLIPVPTAAQLTEYEVGKIIHEIEPKLIIAASGVPYPSDPPCRVVTEEVMVAMQSLPMADFILGDPERLGYVIYTSGTSGKPRAVCHAHRAIWARRMMWDGWYSLRQDDRLLHAGAFNWTYTLGTGLMDPWTKGATALIPCPGTDSTTFPQLIRAHKASLFAAAPGVYRQLLKTNETIDAPQLRHGFSAGEKLPISTKERWRTATGTEIFEAYGMSECSTFVSGCPDHPPSKRSFGYPQQGRRIAVLDETGALVPSDTLGTLAVSNRDPGLMLGYWNAEDETKSRFIGEWFVTGDTVSMAKDGAITYLGRADDMMNAGGFRVSPIEVESALNAHPDVHESAVAEVRVKADTTVIAAFYTADKPLTDDDLNRFAATRLARYKTPRLFVRVETLPKGANGKLLRRALRQEYEDLHGQA
ncbi:class I adenylate-forming enzyme family protein [Pseudohalocynthiibacter aestuariivivens]|jgi:acyl-coenzyme A synthetase/AMP-(fatty) acid ligase|uniref:Class I adenylate-forming enzyme family protein n=1 Tax=Pseudohalocynthiibacter aestuariivivens TaxID=1591409 RepID=A0ABV5JFX8_9RHOB|nr:MULTISPECIES: class I adenylate-forming enzyme family protein [Pseudohalocynthiibacter]MBS9716307.1 acyl--CoA ligase [Pseudohalocynthiibacter aestuariivivens]MCK0100885.1 acyl--CoA ligase [Pseudohalocynthiibacter sp. F2068]